MDGAPLDFGPEVMALTVQWLPLLAAFGLALLIRSPLHVLLVVLNLWLFMEIATTVLVPGYTFAALLWPRLVASALQVAIGWGVLILWRYWRMGTQRVTAD